MFLQSTFLKHNFAESSITILWEEYCSHSSEKETEPKGNLPAGVAPI